MSGINDFVIENGVLKKYKGIEETVAIPEGVTSIGDRAFYMCSKLVNVSLPESVISIGIGAFRGCQELQSIVMPKNVMNIGQQAAENAPSLR